MPDYLEERVARALSDAYDECPDAMLKLDPRIWKPLAKAALEALQPRSDEVVVSFSAQEVVGLRAATADNPLAHYGAFFAARSKLSTALERE